MPDRSLPRVEDLVPEVRGRGVVSAGGADVPALVTLLADAGYEVRQLDGNRVTTRGSALRALAAALDLPGAADRNLDALLDTLRDLPDRRPPGSGVVLVWREADRLKRQDPDGWAAVHDVLQCASEELADHGFAFETVACGVGSEVDS